MRSQDQRNRTPRPFKTGKDSNRWSGSGGDKGFIPGAKPGGKVGGVAKKVVEKADGVEDKQQTERP